MAYRIICHMDTNLVVDGRIDDASKLSNIFGYQNDCIVLNDKVLLFDTIYEDIYPEELPLLNTNISSLHQGKFKHYLYDKHADNIL